MAAGVPCSCPDARTKAKRKRWIVLMRNHHRSAFAGYHWTPSDWSSVGCLDCGGIWRTKAKYVDTLPDGKHEDMPR